MKLYRGQIAAKSSPIVRQIPASPRRGAALAVALAAMVLMLLMLGALARRVLLEHRAIDSQQQALQAEWLLWSAERRAEALSDASDSLPAEWSASLSEQDPVSSFTAKFSPSIAAQTTQIEVTWTTPHGIRIQRSRTIPTKLPKQKDTP